MQHEEVLIALLSKLGLQCEPWGKDRVAILRQSKSGEDVMIVVNEPRSFGPYFITELYGVAAFFDSVAALPDSIPARLLSLNHELPYGHWSIAVVADDRIAVQFVIKLLTPENPYAPDPDLFAMATSGIADKVADAKQRFFLAMEKMSELRRGDGIEVHLDEKRGYLELACESDAFAAWRKVARDQLKDFPDIAIDKITELNIVDTATFSARRNVPKQRLGTLILAFVLGVILALAIVGGYVLIIKSVG